MLTAVCNNYSCLIINTFIQRTYIINNLENNVTDNVNNYYYNAINYNYINNIN